MTREVYNMLSKVLDHLEAELAEKKSMEASVSQPQGEQQTNESVQPAIKIKIDMNISVE